MAVELNDVYAIALEQRLFGQTVINTFAAKVVEAPQTADEPTWLQAMFGVVNQGFNGANGLLAELSEIQSNEVTYIGWHVRRVMPTKSAVFSFAAVGILAGTLTTTCETANTAMSITRRNTLPGKRRRGRVAVAGIPVASMSAGVWSAEILAEAAGFAAQIRGIQDFGVLGELQMGWYVPQHEYKRNGVVIPVSELWNDATATTVRTTVRTQRSRTVGRGI